jgi:diguanylate cyclase (GGDEF)-like protein
MPALSSNPDEFFRERDDSPIVEWLLHDDQVMRECFQHATGILKTVTGAQITAVLLLDAEHQHYRAEAGLSVHPIPRRQSLSHYAVQSEALFVVEDATADARFAQCVLVRAAPFVRFYAAIPLRAPDGQLVGALCAMDSAPRTLTDPGRDVFEHLRAIIENDLKLRCATATDPVTRLFNRRFMLESIRRKWREAAPEESITAVMVDIDWFKQFNDTYGHPAGDVCLQRVAAVLQAFADEHHGIAGRMGGEEFGLLLSGLPEHAIPPILEQLRCSVAALAIAHRHSHAGVVTVSVGAALALGSSSSQAAFATADMALYRAKHAGRNAVVMY